MTAQIREILILDGQKTSMASCPDIPDELPELRACDVDDQSEPGYDRIFGSTACWRGYQGTWEIRDGHLYLVDIRGRYRLRSTDSKPIPATWFTGALRVPRGERLQYVHMGFGSVYEEELHIEVVAGKVEGTTVIDNRGKTYDERNLVLKSLPGRVTWIER